MAYVFLASMHLTCDSTSPDVLNEFDRIWTRRLQASWSALSMPSEFSIEDQLAGVLLNGCRSRISADVGTLALGADVFEPGSWSLDPDGWYVQSRAVRVSSASSSELLPWVLQGANDRKAAICAYAKFRLVEVPDRKSATASSGGAK